MEKEILEKIGIFLAAILITFLMIQQIQHLFDKYKKEVGLETQKKYEEKISGQVDTLTSTIKKLISLSENTQKATSSMDLDKFSKTKIKVGQREITVAVADTPSLRRQGFKSIEELPSIDGMLFVYPEATTTAFWMKNTLIPLRIGFYSPQGDFIEEKNMDPCEDNSCEIYFSKEKFQYALEVPMNSGIKLNSPLSL